MNQKIAESELSCSHTDHYQITKKASHREAPSTNIRAGIRNATFAAASFSTFPETVFLSG
jgi:hypothetical protein